MVPHVKVRMACPVQQPANRWFLIGIQFLVLQEQEGKYYWLRYTLAHIQKKGKRRRYHRAFFNHRTPVEL